MRAYCASIFFAGCLTACANQPEVIEAALNGNSQAVGKLIEQGADPETVGQLHSESGNYTILQAAFLSGDRATQDTADQRIDFCVSDGRRLTVYYAAARDRLDILERWRQRCPDKVPFEAMLVGSTLGYGPAVFRHALKRVKDVNLPGYPENALNIGALRANCDFLLGLLRAGADPNRRGTGNRSALHYAVSNPGDFLINTDDVWDKLYPNRLVNDVSRSKCVRILLENGADPHAKSGSDRDTTVLDYYYYQHSDTRPDPEHRFPITAQVLQQAGVQGPDFYSNWGNVGGNSGGGGGGAEFLAQAIAVGGIAGAAGIAADTIGTEKAIELAGVATAKVLSGQANDLQAMTDNMKQQQAQMAQGPSASGSQPQAPSVAAATGSGKLSLTCNDTRRHMCAEYTFSSTSDRDNFAKQCQRMGTSWNGPCPRKNEATGCLHQSGGRTVVTYTYLLDREAVARSCVPPGRLL
ncbi:MAG: ankyrin repeat domain-containing protein [Alphaproteobacteria bacterium]|nr:ankyrin repeat domain-containing protein [Alphaproteobacteria bacterium]